MTDITSRVTSLGYNTEQKDLACVEDFVKNESIKQALFSQKAGQSKNIFDSSMKDPLLLIDELLSKFIEIKMEKADEEAKSIERKADAIAEINRLWGLVMQDNLPDTNPSNNNTTPLGDSVSGAYLEQINNIITDTLNNPDGIKAITGKDLSESKEDRVSYNELQAMNATMTAYCDTIQVDLDTQQQAFKNIMTLISSAQEEIRDVRRAIVALARG